MMKKLVMLVLFISLAVLAACGNDDNASGGDEIKMLDVVFNVPKTAKVDETVELKANVTYGDEKVKEAEEVVFEYWEKGDEDNSTKVDAKNNGDGTYTAEVAFDHEGIFEMYAHTTAEGLHKMPKKSITVEKGSDTKN
ncbi:hypothetical protein GCM10011409_10900 [Lentibacillus populi]|uniref:YtkA-like domain-containing protein n=1 Tax=Lentibacillus populi TaxID=1827502 RepID=A0A9W5TVU3_9BACI|nr:FixH family protein [Lentibacillus populi]GGB35240.1 hypothetical protein GCM10011409_10900 [Lentibacillus populi]